MERNLCRSMTACRHGSSVPSSLITLLYSGFSYCSYSFLMKGCRQLVWTPYQFVQSGVLLLLRGGTVFPLTTYMKTANIAVATLFHTYREMAPSSLLWSNLPRSMEPTSLAISLSISVEGGFPRATPIAWPQSRFSSIPLFRRLRCTAPS